MFKIYNEFNDANTSRTVRFTDSYLKGSIKYLPKTMCLSIYLFFNAVNMHSIIWKLKRKTRKIKLSNITY